MKRKKTDSCALCGLCHWVDCGLLWFETAVNMILILQKSLIEVFQSLVGFSLQFYMKARWHKAEKEPMDSNECRKRRAHLSWYTNVHHEIFCVLFSDLSCRQPIKIYTKKIDMPLQVKIISWENMVLIFSTTHIPCITYVMFIVPVTVLLKALATQNNSTLKQNLNYNLMLLRRF